tara:strand:- start:69 stop:332 length:264 start_codon:yes stop_codon:yes gene_type:complete
MEMSEQQIKAMVIMNIIDNCTIELDNIGQERYSLNGQQFGKCVDTLVKNINVIQCCKSDSEQLSRRPNTSSTWECFTKADKQKKGNI